MRRVRSFRTVAVAIVASVVTASGMVAATAATPAPFKIGVITCKTGVFAAYGDAYLEGLTAGLKWVNDKKLTKGRKIQIVSTIDDKTLDNDAAVAGFKSLVASGAKVIMGSCSSAIAANLAALAPANKVIFMPGPAAVDALSGINRNTFRTGRQTQQDLITAFRYLDDAKGKKVVSFVEDTTFGQGNAIGFKAMAAAEGAISGEDVLVPATATDGTTYAKKVADQKPDLVFVAWAGAAAKVNPWTSLKQQGVLDESEVITGLANQATWNLVGGSDVKYLSHYFNGAAGTAEEKFLITELKKKNKTPDLFSPDGFNAALMVARVATADTKKDDVNKMITSLENYSFNSVKGKNTIRKADHALIQPMFHAALVRKGRQYSPVKLATISAVTPPVNPAATWK